MARRSRLEYFHEVTRVRSLRCHANESEPCHVDYGAETPQPAAPSPDERFNVSTAPTASTPDQPLHRTATASDQSADPSTAPKETHNKNKNDIDDIGNRNVGNRGLGDWYSLDTDIKIGKQYAMMVEQNAKLIQDPVITEYVNRIGQNLVRNSDAKVPFTIKVIDSDEINAFASTWRVFLRQQRSYPGGG